MFIDGTWAQIGDTSIDLSNYLQKVENAIEGNFVTLSASGALVDAGVGKDAIVAHLSNNSIHITAEERSIWNDAAELANSNFQEIAALVKISQEDATKLAELPFIK
jgi:hypothetical protein